MLGLAASARDHRRKLAEWEPSRHTEVADPLAQRWSLEDREVFRFRAGSGPERRLGVPKDAPREVRVLLLFARELAEQLRDLGIVRLLKRGEVEVSRRALDLQDVGECAEDDGRLVLGLQRGFHALPLGVDALRVIVLGRGELKQPRSHRGICDGPEGDVANEALVRILVELGELEETQVRRDAGIHGKMRGTPTCTKVVASGPDPHMLEESRLLHGIIMASAGAPPQEVEYGIRRITGLSFDAARERTMAALKEAGFGVITEIDVRETLKKKLGVDSSRYVILGACDPTLAHKALAIDPRVGLLRPTPPRGSSHRTQRIGSGMRSRRPR